jgi:hypothetical protein
MMSLAIGGILILLFHIVSRSSINDIIDINTPITRIIANRFSSNGEKSANKYMSGLIINNVVIIDIPAQYGAGDRHFSLL